MIKYYMLFVEIKVMVKKYNKGEILMSKTKWEEYLEKQTEELVKQFRGELDFPVAADNEEVLENYAKRINGKVERLEKYEQAIVINTGDRFELFVKADEKQYRAIFKEYLARYYNCSDDLPREYHVDHLYNKKRFQDKYIRLILLPATINSSWGSNIEKHLTRLDSGKNRKKEYYMDYFTFLKAILFRAAKTSERETQTRKKYIEEAVEHLTKLGVFDIDDEVGRLTMTAQLVAEFNLIEHGIWTNDEERLRKFLAKKKQ